MKSVLVTGGAGLLGSAVVRALLQAGAPVRILSHRPPTPDRPRNAEWAQADLRTGKGLAEALAGMDTVVHCHSNPLTPPADVVETKALLAAAREAGISHFLAMSIVGIDSLGFFDYYQAKLDIERMLPACGMPYSILRASQFHQFVVYILTLLLKGPFLLSPPGVKLQPIAVDAVGKRLADAALGPPTGRLPDIVGPDLLPLRCLARTWLRATHRHALMLPVSLPIPALRAMRQLTVSDAEQIGESWDDWVAGHATEPSPYERARTRSAER